jgi:uncharacterized protein involved in exopolysaccharide biosynthesis
MVTFVNSHPEDELDLAAIFRWLWRRRALLFGFVIVGAIIGVILSYMASEQFTAKVTLIPQKTTDRGGLLGRLASFGGLGGEEGEIQEGLYGQVLHSDRVLDKVLLHRWMLGGTTENRTIGELFGLEIDLGDKTQESALASDMLKNKLRNGIIKFSQNPINGLMTVAVTIPEDPFLAAQLANFLVSELEAYNRDVHSATARKHTVFVSERLAFVDEKLNQSETEMMLFVQENRHFSESPTLTRKYGEIEREVRANRTIWIDLRAQVETAKIEEHRLMTAIRVLDKAKPPTRRSSPNRIWNLFVGVCSGLLAGILVAGFRARRGAKGRDDASVMDS